MATFTTATPKAMHKGTFLAQHSLLPWLMKIDAVEVAYLDLQAALCGL